MEVNYIFIQNTNLSRNIFLLQTSLEFSEYAILNRYRLEYSLKNHCRRTSLYAITLTKLIKSNKTIINEIKKAALLHDIGKILINKKILNKTSKLTLEEFNHMKTHSKLGINVLKSCDYSITTINGILYHHEKWNGTGYPFGLLKDEIPLEARIISIVDCYDALTSKRCYKENLSHKEALEIIKKESNKSFDPYLVSIFVEFEYKFENILNTHLKNNIF